MVLGSAIGPGVTGLGIETQYIGVALYFVLTTVIMSLGIIRARPLLPARAT